jgi:hypothetical protein
MKVCGAQDAVCSNIHAKHKNILKYTVREASIIFSVLEADAP